MVPAGWNLMGLTCWPFHHFPSSSQEVRDELSSGRHVKSVSRSHPAGKNFKNTAVSHRKLLQRRFAAGLLCTKSPSQGQTQNSLSTWHSPTFGWASSSGLTHLNRLEKPVLHPNKWDSAQNLLFYICKSYGKQHLCSLQCEIKQCFHYDINTGVCKMSPRNEA